MALDAPTGLSYNAVPEPHNAGVTGPVITPLINSPGLASSRKKKKKPVALARLAFHVRKEPIPQQYDRALHGRPGYVRDASQLRPFPKRPPTSRLPACCHPSQPMMQHGRPRHGVYYRDCGLDCSSCRHFILRRSALPSATSLRHFRGY